MYSNLYKPWQVIIGGDTRVIDSNELMKKKLQNIANTTQNYFQGEAAAEGFVGGLSAEELDELTVADGQTVVKNTVVDELNEVMAELEQAKAELSDVQQQAQQILEDAYAEAEGLKAKAMEEARAQGYREGYKQGMDEVGVLKEECHAKAQQLEQEYFQAVNELEPQFVENLTQIYEHIFKVDLSSYHQLVTTLLTDAMQRAEATGNIIVHVAKENYAAVSGAKAELLEQTGLLAERIDIVPDMTLAPSQCMIETEGGVYDCSLETELKELTKKLTLLSYKGGK